MSRALGWASVLIAVFTIGAVSVSAVAQADVPPTPPPSAFGGGVVNKFFPVVPGSRLVYEGVIDGVRARESFVTTNDIKVIEGVSTNVIRDTLYLKRSSGDGFYVAELTSDYYATANDGTVWYFGEDTAEYAENGHLITLDGSWRAGLYGSQAGVFMEATPTIGKVVQQESATEANPWGPAKDLFKVVAIDGDRLVTREWTPLEPGLVTKKVWKAGVGQVVEDTVKGAQIEDLLLTLDSSN